MQNKTVQRLRLPLTIILIIIFTLCVVIHMIRQNNLDQRLMEAISLDKGPSAVQDLIRQGANANSGSTDFNEQPIYYAVRSGSPEVVKVLLDAGATVQPEGYVDVGPIFAVTWQTTDLSGSYNETRCRAVVQELQAKGETIEDRDSMGFTPLMRAVWSGNVMVTKTLLDLNAKTDVVNYHGQTIWDLTDTLPGGLAELKKLVREHNMKPGLLPQ